MTKKKDFYKILIIATIFFYSFTPPGRTDLSIDSIVNIINTYSYTHTISETSDYLDSLFYEVEINIYDLLKASIYEDINKLNSISIDTTNYELSHYKNYLIGKSGIWGYGSDLDQPIIQLINSRNFFSTNSDKYPNIINDINLNLGTAYGGYSSIDSLSIGLNILSQLLAQEEIDPQMAFEAHYQSAYIAENSQDPELALKHNLEAERLNAVHDLFDVKNRKVAALRTNLSIALRQANEFELAQYYADLSIKSFSGDQHRNERIKAKINMAQVYMAQGKYENSIKYYQKILDEEKVSFFTEPWDFINLHNNWADPYMSIQDFDKCLALHNFILPYKKKYFGEHSPEVAFTYFLLGQISYQKSDLEEALSLYTESHKILIEQGINNQQTSDLLRAMGETYTALKEYEKGLDHINQSIMAVSLTKQMPKDMSQVSDRRAYLYSLIDWIRLLYGSKISKGSYGAVELNDAIIFFDGIIDQFIMHSATKSTQKNYLESIQEVYDIAINEAYKEKNKEDIFYYIERSKSVLLKLEQANRIDPNISKDLYAPVLSLRKEIDKTNKSLLHEEDTASIDSLRERLITLNVLLRETEDDINPQKSILSRNYVIKDLQNNLDQNEILLEYHVADSVLTILKISKEKVSINQIAYDSLRNDIKKFISMTKNGAQGESGYDINDFVHIGHTIYHNLLGTFEPHITAIIVIPDDIISYIPFAGLPIQKHPVTSYGDIQYLITQYDVRQEYSGSMIYSDNRSGEYKYEYVGFAPFAGKGLNDKEAQTLKLRGIDNVRSFYGQLPFTHDEVVEFAKTLSGIHFIDTSATPINFAKYGTQAKILHIASHAYAEDENSYLQSGIALFNQNNEISFLNSYEIQNMYCENVLTLLSACETGVGEFISGEGVSSIARSFKYAGSKNIVMSLWQVSDYSTSQIISLLHPKLKSGEGVSSALRNSQLEFLDSCTGFKSKLAHPYYWSGLLLVGSNEPIFEHTNYYRLLSGGLIVILTIMCIGYFYLDQRGHLIQKLRFRKNENK